MLDAVDPVRRRSAQPIALGVRRAPQPWLDRLEALAGFSIAPVLMLVIHLKCPRDQRGHALKPFDQDAIHVVLGLVSRLATRAKLPTVAGSKPVQGPARGMRHLQHGHAAHVALQEVADHRTAAVQVTALDRIRRQPPYSGDHPKRIITSKMSRASNNT